MTETLLINFLFLLIPALAYLIFFENKFHFNHNSIHITVFSAVSMILCMSFPIRLELGFIFDLRYIPFIIVSLFSGYKATFPLFIVLNLYRLYIGGDGVLLSFLFSTLIFSVVPLFSKKFINLDTQKRILTAGSITFVTFTIYLFIYSTLLETVSKTFWMNAFSMLFIYVIGIIVILSLIEKIIDNVKTREKLVDTERLNVLSELAASISHEIRNPLTVTKGFLQLLNNSTNITNDEKRYVDFSLQELKRAEKIVSDFLSLAKPQAENMVSTNLKEEIEYVNNIMIPYANIHQVDLQYNFNNTLTKRFDKNQIQQTLINLYKNGIESMKDKGGTLTINVSQQKNKIIIKITDTGIGMTKEEIMRIGKPYYSTKQEGTGLGMMVVYSTINKLKGKIEVNSEKGKGTTFLITIPVNN
ncbi:sensor histidine kinase [Bacillus sp. Marseille-P3661]|uniref:sensor histidine kinase n=1 Tax=Bacillus sp. Marseille-P3661 TaxID=1936234 RepID=UPI000C814912|nr:HAMP domain-containing sensor histidine kinase [Bacillus sp. Marseille-P3661]